MLEKHCSREMKELHMAAVLTNIKAETGDDSGCGACSGVYCFDSALASWAPKGSVSMRDACFLGPCMA